MVVYTKVSTYFNVENKLSYEYYATFVTIVFLHFYISVIQGTQVGSIGTLYTNLVPI